MLSWHPAGRSHRSHQYGTAKGHLDVCSSNPGTVSSWVKGQQWQQPWFPLWSFPPWLSLPDVPFLSVQANYGVSPPDSSFRSLVQQFPVGCFFVPVPHEASCHQPQGLPFLLFLRAFWQGHLNKEQLPDASCSPACHQQATYVATAPG